MVALHRELKAIVRTGRELEGREWFALARRFLRARRYIRTRTVPPDPLAPSPLNSPVQGESA
jgi:hypothetical protein